MTWAESVTVDISARCDGGKWTAVLTSLTGNYSEQTRLFPPSQQEVTGPGGNTTQANFCAQVIELNAGGHCPPIGDDPALWYMLAAVKAHEDVHLAHFQPGLAIAAPKIEPFIEALSVPTAPGKTQAQAIAEIKGLPEFAIIVDAATDIWRAAEGQLVKGDHDPYGPTYIAERSVVDPMIARICAYAKANNWGFCTICPQ